MTTAISAAWPVSLIDPYPGLAALRNQAAVHWLEGIESFVVVSHAEAAAILHAPDAWTSDLRANPRVAARFGAGQGDTLLTSSLLFSDPPDHTRLRRAVSPYLSPRAIAAFRPRIAAIVDAAFAALAPDQSVDVLADLAYPIPLAVICELLNADPDTAVAFRHETPALVGALDPLADEHATAAATSAALSLMLELVPLVATRTTGPATDLVSMLLAGTARAGGLDVDQTIMMLLLLLAAGHETTSTLMANATIVLLERPELIQRLRAQPDLIPAAVEELLRFESPVQLVGRTACRRTRIGPVPIEPGTQVLISIGAVNRDPSVFDHPDDVTLGRAAPHLAFGHGIHFCAGAALARVESQEILRRLISPAWALETRQATFERDTSPTFRRLRALRLSAAC